MVMLLAVDLSPSDYRRYQATIASQAHMVAIPTTRA